jgi:hypothetical protein
MTRQLSVEARTPMETSQREPTTAPETTVLETGPAPVRTPTVQRPGLWLLVVVAVAVGLRVWHLNDPFQQDEFGPLYAVAERTVPPGSFPTASDPLRPVPTLQEVRERSLLPYAIVNPHPLYNYVLYLTVRALPIAEWSLRLPSLLAGVGCVVWLYFLCRRRLGVEAALAAALLAAVEPIQVGSSVLCRPYAVSNLACVATFAALLGVLFAERAWVALVAAAGYGVALAAIGYLQPALLLVAFAHVGMVVYGLATHPRAKVGPRALLWLAACLLAGVLLLPDLGYLRAVQEFATVHRHYLINYSKAGLSAFFIHNGGILAALLVVTVATYVIRELRAVPAAPAAAAKDTGNGQPADRPTEPTQLEDPDLVWTGRMWLFLPQLVAVMLVYISSMTIFTSRYLSYTSLGGAILLAYWATRDRSRDVRLGTALAAAVTLFLWGLLPTYWSSWGLHTQALSRDVVSRLNDLDEQGYWKPGDVLLFRAGFLEGDFLPERVPAVSRDHIEKLLAAPLTTLYAPEKPKPYVVLSLSHRFGDTYTACGRQYEPGEFYNTALAEKVRRYERFWVYTNIWNRQPYMACLLPWLADALQWDLKVNRDREEGQRHLDVWTDVQPNDYVAGLSDSRATDFPPLVLVRRKQPKGIFALGALGAAPLPAGYVTVPVWLAGQARTPRLTAKPENEGETERAEEKNP